MTAAETRAVVAALTAEGATVRFVGGCVRDAVLDLTVRDVDIATPDAPDRVSALLKAAGIKAIPTGVDHGTVTAVTQGRHFEITTLRRDVETDGRHAVVAYTDDWETDAARRDFTINALYADPDGTVYDPVGGLPDIRAGRLRFVGEPAKRIEEDALRILRFFRFFAYYGRSQPDVASLDACATLAERVVSLSAERVSAELLRLYGAPDPLSALSMMAAAGVLQQVLPEATRLEPLHVLLQIEVSADIEADALLRLAATISEDASTAVAGAIADRLRLSNAQRGRLGSLVAPPFAVVPDMSDHDMHVGLYRVGRAAFADLVWLTWSRQGVSANLMPQVKMAAAWDIPKFPLRGEDVAELGVAEGPDIGNLLHRVEAWWIAADFAADRDACLRQLRDVARQSGATL
ncbi:MAG: CCA tRNA nucleotidyltransferase [Alphaproteobacteria bacterium]